MENQTNQTKQFNSEKEKAKILDRISKLLSVANGTQYEEEAKTAMRMAQSYMKQYGLSLSDVELQKELEEEIGCEELDEHTKARNPERWSKLLAKAVGTIFDCSSYTRVHCSGTQRASKLIFAGYKSDVKFAKLLFTTLYVGIRATACKSLPEGAGKPRLSFMYGVAERLLERAKIEKRGAEQESTGRYALVVVERSKRVANWLKANTNLRYTNHRHVSFDSRAYYKGREYGNNIDLMSRKKVVGPTVAIPYLGVK